MGGGGKERSRARQAGTRRAGNVLRQTAAFLSPVAADLARTAAVNDDTGVALLADDDDFLDGVGQRKNAVVLQQHVGVRGNVSGQRIVRIGGDVAGARRGREGERERERERGRESEREQ